MKRLTVMLASGLLMCGCDTTPTTAAVTSALDEQGPQQVTLSAAEIFGDQWDEWVPLCGPRQAERVGHSDVAHNSVVLRAAAEKKVVELNPTRARVCPVQNAGHWRPMTKQTTWRREGGWQLVSQPLS